MADNELAVQDVKEAEFEYAIRIEDAGPATKKVSIDIPQDRIASKLEEQFKELRSQAAIPGFRPGHAPRKLVEKRFSNDVREQVRRSLISESFEQAVTKHSLAVIGEPHFEDPEGVKLPESGDLTYTFQVEVQPEFVLPPLEGLLVKRPNVKVTEQHIDQAMKTLRGQEGAIVPVEDRGVEADDHLVADVHIFIDGQETVHRHDARIIAAAGGSIVGFKIEDLDQKLAGLKPGESRDIEVKIPDTNPDEKLRGKTVRIEVALKDIKKIELAEVNDVFLDRLGMGTEAELREALREQMGIRVTNDIQQAMRDQVSNYLLQNVQIDIPANLSKQQTSRVVSRRAMSLKMRGVSAEEIRGNIELLATGAQDEALRELKLFFILQKIANDAKVDVSEGELNGEISLIALRGGKRPEKVKQEMSADGSLQNLYVQMRENKAVDAVLAKAKIEDVEPNAALPGAVSSDAPAGAEAAGDGAKSEAKE